MSECVCVCVCVCALNRLTHTLSHLPASYVSAAQMHAYRKLSLVNLSAYWDTHCQTLATHMEDVDLRAFLENIGLSARACV